MDVKDVNSNAANVLFNKTSLVNSAAGATGAGFASFLGVENIIPSKENVSPEASAKKENNNQVSSSDDRRKDKEAASIRDKLSHDKKPQAADKNKPVEKADKKTSKSRDVASNSVEDVVVPVSSVQSPETPVAAVVAPESIENTVPAIGEGDSLNAEAQILIHDKLVSLKDFMLNPELLPQGMVEIFDPQGSLGLPVNAQTGMALVNSEDLKTALIAQQAALDKAGVSIEGMEIIKNGETINLTQVVASDASAAVAKPLKSSQNPEANALEDAQDSLSDETPDLLSKLDIKVEVKDKGEKIAYHSTSDLVKDKTIVNTINLATLPSASKEGTPTVANNPAVSSNPLQAAQANDNAAVNNIAPAAAALQAQSIPEASVDAKAATLAVKDVNSVSLAQMSAGGSEFVNAAKAEAANKATDASFKDVYKGMSKEVAEQVKVNITKSAVKGVDKIDISLKPEDLGRIEIKMQIAKDGKLQAHIISSRPETLDMLQKEMQTLEKAFNDAGFQTDEGALSFSFRDDSQAGQNSNSNSELRHFIGNVFEKEANNELTVEAPMEWNNASGLNIRV